jgi:hypothetical protein
MARPLQITQLLVNNQTGVALLLGATLSARRTRLPGGAGGFVLALLGASCASNGYQERDSRWPQGRGGHANGVRDR